MARVAQLMKSGRRSPLCLRQLHVELLKQSGDQERDGLRSHHLHLRYEVGREDLRNRYSPYLEWWPIMSTSLASMSPGAVLMALKRTAVTTGSSGTVSTDMPGTALTAAIVGSCCDYTKVGIQIIGNVVDNIGPWGQVNQTHGIYLASANGVVENNIVTRADRGLHSELPRRHPFDHLQQRGVANCGRYALRSPPIPPSRRTTTRPWPTTSS